MSDEIKNILPATPLKLANLPIHFIDVETVTTHKYYPSETIEGELFKKKFSRDIKEQYPDERMIENASEDVYNEKAALSAEFGKVVCISVGLLYNGQFFIKSLCNRDEKLVLSQFSEAISKATALCAHNGLEFDYPFLTRRYIVNNLPVPELLQIAGKKPWEMSHLMDTMKLWSHTQWNYKVSLETLAFILGLPNPKATMNGAMVNEIYWAMFDKVGNDELPFEHEKTALSTIAHYCEGDVFTLANVYLRMKGLEVMGEEIIKAVEA